MKKHISIGSETVSTKDFMKWLNALWSGEYKQTRNELQNYGGFCCLGVACNLFIKPELQIRKLGFLYGQYPIHQDAAPNWLKSVSLDFQIRTKGHGLPSLNDHHMLTFSEIADVLYSIYILEVLK